MGRIIITDKLRRDLTKQLFNNVEATDQGDSDNYYYIAVSRSQTWQPDDGTDNSPENTNNTEREERLFRYNMQSVKAIENFAYVVPNVDWVSGTVYSAYDDTVSGQPDVSYYVRTEENNVYICVQTGKTATGATKASTAKPDHTDLTLTEETDGYVWKYMYTITTTETNNFLTSAWMPTRFIEEEPELTSPLYGHYSVQDGAVRGQVIGYRVVEGGGPFTTAPDIRIEGNGSGAKARAILNSSAGIGAVVVDDSDGAATITTRMGTDYDWAKITVVPKAADAAATLGTVEPIFAHRYGLGADAREDLRCTAVMFNVKPSGNEEDTWQTGNEYRQVGIMKNILNYNPDHDSDKFTETQGAAFTKISLTTQPGDGAITYTDDEKITQTYNNVTSTAWLDYYDNVDELWFHQDEETGFNEFTAGQSITVVDQNSYTIDTITDPDIDIMSGELLFIDARPTPVTRNEAGIEDIKAVIKL